MTLINIITRTSGRPKYFAEHWESVKNQTYPNIRHVIGSDNAENLSYLKEVKGDLEDVYSCQKMRKTEAVKPWHGVNLYHAPYNLYFNGLYPLVEDGWIMHLDDDDILASPEAIEQLAKELTDPDEIVLFQGKFVSGIKPSTKIGESSVQAGVSPGYGQIGGRCFAFHSSKAWDVQWDQWSAGDLRVLQQLFFLCDKKKFVPLLVTDTIDGHHNGNLKDKE